MKTTTAVTLETIATVLQAQLLTDKAGGALTGCYIGDLLSDVLAHARPGVLWVTIQTHRNVVSVASMKDIAAVLVTCGRTPEPEIIREAQEENVVLLVTPLSTYEVAGKLWEAGIR